MTPTPAPTCPKCGGFGVAFFGRDCDCRKPEPRPTAEERKLKSAVAWQCSCGAHMNGVDAMREHKSKCSHWENSESKISGFGFGAKPSEKPEGTHWWFDRRQALTAYQAARAAAHITPFVPLDALEVAQAQAKRYLEGLKQWQDEAMRIEDENARLTSELEQAKAAIAGWGEDAFETRKLIADLQDENALLTRELEGERAGVRKLRIELGARTDETFPGFVERLAKALTAANERIAELNRQHVQAVIAVAHEEQAKDAAIARIADLPTNEDLIAVVRERNAALAERDLARVAELEAAFDAQGTLLQLATDRFNAVSSEAIRYRESELNDLTAKLTLARELLQEWFDDDYEGEELLIRTGHALASLGR